MSARVTIVSGFLGAGKTSLIRALIGGVCAGERLAVIENEFGDVGIDGDFLQNGRLRIHEIQSGCICCSLASDFSEALHGLAAQHRPDRILFEPSGVARLSDIRAVVARAVSESPGSLTAGGVITVADASRCAMYHEQFGAFYGDQLENAQTILLSRTDAAAPSDVQAAEALIRRLNPRAVLLAEPWERLRPDVLLRAVNGGLPSKPPDRPAARVPLRAVPVRRAHTGRRAPAHPFESWSAQNLPVWTKEALHAALLQVDQGLCGAVLRLKGIVFCADGRALPFDYTPGHIDIRTGAQTAPASGRLCAIGTALDRERLAALFCCAPPAR